MSNYRGGKWYFCICILEYVRKYYKRTIDALEFISYALWHFLLLIFLILGLVVIHISTNFFLGGVVGSISPLEFVWSNWCLYLEFENNFMWCYIFTGRLWGWWLRRFWIFEGTSIWREWLIWRWGTQDLHSFNVLCNDTLVEFVFLQRLVYSGCSHSLLFSRISLRMMARRMVNCWAAQNLKKVIHLKMRYKILASIFLMIWNSWFYFFLT